MRLTLAQEHALGATFDLRSLHFDMGSFYRRGANGKELDHLQYSSARSVGSVTHRWISVHGGAGGTDTLSNGYLVNHH